MSEQKKQGESAAPVTTTFGDSLLRLNYTWESRDWKVLNGYVQYDRHRLVGFAAQKGVFFNIQNGRTLYGRDGVARLVKESNLLNALPDTSCCDMLGQALWIRWMALLDVVQFLIFGTLLLIAIACIAVGSLAAMIVLLCGTCHPKIQLYWRGACIIFISSIFSCLAHIVLYLCLPLELLFPEWVMTVLKLQEWGTESPMLYPTEGGPRV